MEAHIQFSYQFYNLISIFTSGFLLFWFIWALSRFYDTLRIRSAILSGRLVPIRGLNNYLTTFAEITSQTHVNVIIHTRQANPPKSIKSIYLPYNIDKILYFNNQYNKKIELNLWLSNRCRVFILFDFDLVRWNELLRIASQNNRSNNRFIHNNHMNFQAYLHNLWSLSASDAVCFIFFIHLSIIHLDILINYYRKYKI